MSVIHPAHSMSFTDLITGLRSAVKEGYVSEKIDRDLSIFCYTKKAVLDGVWTQITTIARGLVVDNRQMKIVATPFPKFFNVGENGAVPPQKDFIAYEKLDGSLIIAFHHDGEWRTSTKGSFNSYQAALALSMLPATKMMPGTTYLFELTGPSNKIVISYPGDELRLLSAYTRDGIEMSRTELERSDIGDFPMAPEFYCTSFTDLVSHVEKLPADREGYVLLFSDGTRLKLKGAEYRRRHALISRLSPLTVWDAMANGSADAIRTELPEEFLSDFDQMRDIIQAQFDDIIRHTSAESAKWSAATDKEVGLALENISEPARSFLFSFRRGRMDDTRTVASIYRRIRPSGNEISGYVPSYALARASEELSG